MSSIASLLYGFDYDREHFIDYFMQYQFYMPIVAILTCHPAMAYLLIFETKSMRLDLRILYGLTHLALILNEWSFSFCFRMYPVAPIAAFYFEEPLCRSSIDKPILMMILSIPIILICSAFLPLIGRMHQMFLPNNSNLKLSPRSQIILALLLNVLQLSNIAGFYLFGKDHDNSEEIVKEPELRWLSERGGTIFLFGPPGHAQHFKYGIVQVHSSESSKDVQLISRAFIRHGRYFFYAIPLALLFVFIIIDISFLPIQLLAVFRIYIITSLTINSHQLCIVFILNNPSYRRIVVRTFEQFAVTTCGLSLGKGKVSTSVVANNPDFDNYSPPVNAYKLSKFRV